MTFKIKKIALFLFFILLIALIIINSRVVITSVINAASLFFYKVFPSLFPFFVLIDFLINYDFTKYLNIIFNKVFCKLLNISNNGVLVLFFSMLSGLPSNAHMINDLISSGSLSISEANKLLAFTFFPNPMFLVGTVGTLLYNDTFIGLKLLLLIYLTNFIIAFLLRGKSIKKNTSAVKENSKDTFSNVLKKSLKKSFDSLLLILGSITIFTILSNLFSLYSPFNDTINSIITSIFEMTSGIYNISLLNINLKTKIMLTSAALTFSGLSIISQAFSMLSSHNINFKYIIKIRLLAVLINSALVYLFF